MSVIARAAAIALIGVLALATTACTGPSPDPAPTTPQTTPAPIFTTDEQALAAAETAYAAYLVVDAEILAAGGQDAERIKEVVSESYAQRLLPEYKEFAANGFRATGQARLSTTSIVEVGEREISIYGCLDVSEVHFWDASGADVTPAGREPTQALILGFVLTDDGVELDWSDKWTGTDFC